MSRRFSPRDDRTFSTRRIEALTDGVFAIAMTLLVLDLKVAALGHLATSVSWYHALANLNTSVATFIISFLLLGSMWAVHMRQFEYIQRADRRLTMINTLRLLAVVFIPLTTSMAGSYQDLVVGRVLLPINFFVLAALGYWQWAYAVNPKNKLHENVPDYVMEYSDARNKAIMTLSILVIVLSVWIGDAAFILLLFSGVLTEYLARNAKVTTEK